MPASVSDQVGDAYRGFRGRLVLPDTHRKPSGRREQGIGPGISPLVVADLGGPVPSVGRQRSAVDRTAMPEAPIHEHSDFR